jgi:O-acetylserine/cysteine efflux transporter
MKPRHIALAVLVAVIWGVNFVVIRVGLDAMSPLLFCAVRFLVAAVPAVFFVGRPTVKWRWIALTALTLAIAQYSLLFAGIAAGMPAGLSALILQSQAVFTVVLAVPVLRDRPGSRTYAGISISAVGVLLIASRFGLDRPLGAFLLVVAAGAAWGVGNVAIRKAQPANSLNFMVWVSAVSVLPLAGLSLAIDGPSYVGNALRGLDLRGLAAIGFIAWISTLVGFGLWGRLISRYGASTVAPFASLAPVVAIVATGLLLGERVTTVDVVGGVIVVSGVLLGSVPRRSTRPLPVDEPRRLAGTTV